MEVLHILKMNCTCLKNNANLVFEINVLNFWTTLLKLPYQLDICFWNDFFLMLQAKNKVPTQKIQLYRDILSYSKSAYHLCPKYNIK